MRQDAYDRIEEVIVYGCMIFPVALLQVTRRCKLACSTNQAK